MGAGEAEAAAAAAAAAAASDATFWKEVSLQCVCCSSHCPHTPPTHAKRVEEREREIHITPTHSLQRTNLKRNAGEKQQQQQH